jgi:hypothetical protein
MPIFNLRRVAERFGYTLAIHENGLSIAKDGATQYFEEKSWRRAWRHMCAPIYQAA